MVVMAPYNHPPCALVSARSIFLSGLVVRFICANAPKSLILWRWAFTIKAKQKFRRPGAQTKAGRFSCGRDRLLLQVLIHLFTCNPIPALMLLSLIISASTQGSPSLRFKNLMSARAAAVILTDTKSLSRFSIIKFSSVNVQWSSVFCFLGGSLKEHPGFYCESSLWCVWRPSWTPALKDCKHVEPCTKWKDALAEVLGDTRAERVHSSEPFCCCLPDSSVHRSESVE